MARKIASVPRPFQFIEPLEGRVLLSTTLSSTPAMLVAPPPTGGASGTVVAPPNTPVSPVAATGTVSGTVLDANGKAVAGANVTLYQPIVLVESDPIPASSNAPTGSAPGATGTNPVGLWPPGLQATTDANGNFTVNNVPVGQYTASASDPTAGFGVTDLTVTANQTATADITLTPPTIPPVTGMGTVNGNVLDANGNAVAGANVSLLPAIVGIGQPNPTGGSGTTSGASATGGAPSVFGSFITTTDANGNFSLGNVPSGSYTVFADSATAGSGHSSVVVSAGQTENVTINLQPPPPVVTGSVGGTVKDAQGNAIAGASVTLLPPLQPLPGVPGGATGSSGTNVVGIGTPPIVPPLPIHTTTDSQGNFNFAAVPVGTYDLLVTQDGFQPSDQMVTVAQNQPVTVAVTLQAQVNPTPSPTPTPTPTPTPAGNGTAKGTVSDSSGAAVAGALIVLVPSPGPVANGSASLSAAIPSLSSLHTMTDANGNFELDNVPAGDYIAFAAKPGKGFARLTTTVTADQTDTLTFTLSSKLPPPIAPKTVNTLITATRKAQAQAKKAAALAAKKAAQAAKNAAADSKNAAAGSGD